MFDWVLLAEGAAVVAPTAAAAYGVTTRRHHQRWLREPLFWDGGQPVSLATMFAELNGEVDLEAALRELVGGAGPLGGRELERAVQLLQGNQTLMRQLLLDVAADAVLCAAVPGRPAGPGAGVALMEQLSEASAQMGFFALMGHLNRLRPAGAAPLLPVEGLLAGGLPLLPADEAALPGPGGGVNVLGALDALRGAGTDGWLHSLARAVEGLVKDWQLKKAREQVQRAYQQVGGVLVEAMRRRSPAGGQVRRNVYVPLDAYRTLGARVRAGRRGGIGRWVAPSVADQLWEAYGQSLKRATTLVEDKCRTFERVLAGQYGPAAAGELLYRHRAVLLTGLALDAFPLGLVEQAVAEWQQAQERAGAGETP